MFEGWALYGCRREIRSYGHTGKTFCWRAQQQCYSGLVTVKMDIPLIDAFPGPAKQTSRLSGVVYMQSLTT